MQKLTWICLLLCLLTSCDFDLMGGSKRHLVGGYYIEVFEEGEKIYFVSKKGEQSQGGIFEGIVHKVCWDQSIILCDVTKQFRGDRDGYYQVDVKTGKISGPLTKGDCELLMKEKNLRFVAPNSLF